MATRRDLDLINRAASFNPQTSGSVGGEWDGTRPCLTVAGAQVYAYVETVDLMEGPVLVVSIHYDTAGHSNHTTRGPLPSALGNDTDGETLGWTGCAGVPTRVRIGGDLEVVLDREGGMRLVSEP